LRKKGIKTNNAPALYRLQENALFIRRGLVQYSDPVWYPHETAKDKKYVAVKYTAESVLGKYFPDMFPARKDLQQ
jgi:hypothetical protein